MVLWLVIGMDMAKWSISNESCRKPHAFDIFMVPTDAWEPLYFNTIEQVKKGIIPMDELMMAKRILRVKVRAGLLKNRARKIDHFLVE